jgi:hypothetical protein
VLVPSLVNTCSVLVPAITPTATNAICGPVLFAAATEIVQPAIQNYPKEHCMKRFGGCRTLTRSQVKKIADAEIKRP